MSEIRIDLSSVHNHINAVAAALNEGIGVINHNVRLIDEKVESVAQEQQSTRTRLDELYEEFQVFVEEDRKAKELQRALTEIVRVRQELEKEFGHYGVVRRAATGILQATSLELVHQHTMRQVTEELMLTTPRYWLTPALIALSAWIQDSRSLAERAVAEAIRRDDGKTSLFFTLVCRRANRMEAAANWLSRYFQNQDPHAMDREVVVMLDGLANGVFGGGALATCTSIIDQWLEELKARAGFFDEQRARWGEKLDVMTPRRKETDYLTLGYSPTASSLFASLVAARRNQVVLDYFTLLFTGELIVPPTIEGAVDGLLDSLVTNYDDEELPLRREERFLMLIREEAGDREAAQSRFAAETETFSEKTSFASLLTASAMNPEQIHATRATQRYAVSRSREWIIAAHSDLIARDRAMVPTDVELKSGTWEGTSVDGSNERALLDDMRLHYEARIAADRAAITLGTGPWSTLIITIVIGVLTLGSGGTGIVVGLVIMLVGAGFFTWRLRQVARARDEARNLLVKEHSQAEAFLRASLAELADYRREWATEDAKADHVTHLLSSLSSPQFVIRRREQRIAVA